MTIEHTVTVDQRSRGRHGPGRRGWRAGVGALLASVLVLATAPSGGAEDVPASLTVTPHSGLAGDQLAVSGQGCEQNPEDGSFGLAFWPFGRISPGSGVVFPNDVTVEGTSFAGTVTIPALPPGTYPLNPECYTYVENQFQPGQFVPDPIFFDAFDLTVEVPTSPAAADLPLAVGPSSVAPGATVTVSAPAANNETLAQEQIDGFVRNQPVQVVLYQPQPVLLGTTTTGPGTFNDGLLSGAPLSLDVVIPAGTPAGSHQIVAYGAHTADTWWGDYHAGVVAAGPVTVGTDEPPAGDETSNGDEPPAGDETSNGDEPPAGDGVAVFELPATTPDPDGPLTIDGDGTAVPGQEIDISGEGFEPGEEVLIALYSEPVLLGRAEADGSGRLQATVTIPADTPPGPHTLVALGTRSGWVLAASIEVRPVPVTTLTTLPVTGAAGSVPLASAGVFLLIAGAGALLAGRPAADRRTRHCRHAGC